jgi:hypothetical protein
MPLATSDLGSFTGTMEYHRLGFPFKNVVLTDGAQYVAKNGGTHGAYWLMQAIASHIPGVVRKARAAGGHAAWIQFWTLTVNPDRSAVLSCVLDKGEPEIARQRIEYTDFDLGKIDVHVASTEDGDGRTVWVIMLPSEY